MITISIVSHRQINLVEQLCNDLEKYCKNKINLIITLNLPEDVPTLFQSYTFPIRYIRNVMPKGFAANHNAAFQHCCTDYFCVLNPDVRLIDDPFNLLITDFSHENIGMVAPCIINAAGNIQDSARKFPTVLKLLKRVILSQRALDYDMTKTIIYPDWIAGMFMVFKSDVYRKIKGFDEGYYLYCEDIDICARLRLCHYEVLLDTRVKAIHDARRDSHRKWQYLYWHYKSVVRYFYRYYFVPIKRSL